MRARFIIELNFPNKEQKYKLLSLYGDKFFGLIREAKAKKFFALDYRYLPGIRSVLSVHGTVNSLVSVIDGELDDRNVRRLLEVAPIFDASPVDLRAYILLSLGFRNLGIKR